MDVGSNIRLVIEKLFCTEDVVSIHRKFPFGNENGINSRYVFHQPAFSFDHSIRTFSFVQTNHGLLEKLFRYFSEFWASGHGIFSDFANYFSFSIPCDRAGLVAGCNCFIRVSSLSSCYQTICESEEPSFGAALSSFCLLCG